MTHPKDRTTPLDAAAGRAEQRAKLAREDPEPSLGKRFGQIGVLGWIIVIPMLLALLFGRWLDDKLSTGITFSAAMLMLGAALGLWLGLRWMHKQ